MASIDKSKLSENIDFNLSDLVRLGIDMSSLSDYLQNIIKVVNQHAALLDNISDELDARP